MSKPSHSAAGRAGRLAAKGATGSPPPRADSAVLKVRIDLGTDRRIGPGKIELLEQIVCSGSIAAAARAMRMSYRRAWQLVHELDAIFAKPIVMRQVGGSRGGLAELTPLGRALVTRFRALERAATDVAHHHLSALQSEIERQDETPA